MQFASPCLEGDRWTAAHPGDLVFIPRGTVHAFRYNGAGRGRLIGMCTPAGHEVFFRDAGRLAAAGPLEPGPVMELCRRHGIDLVGGPGEAGA